MFLLRTLCNLSKRKVIHFVNNFNSSNVGDNNSSPVLYIQNLLPKNIVILRHDMYKLKLLNIFKNDIVILGGGGLIDCMDVWNRKINSILNKSKNVIYWGGGFNRHTGRKITEQIDISRFLLFGVRDKINGLTWVPCPSCLSSRLKLKYPIKRRIGVVFHTEFVNPKLKKYDWIDNHASMADIIEFIGSSEVILTSSYHAMYWATLMNKRVVIFNVFSDKFLKFPYPPAVFDNDLESAMDKAVSYPNALTECIEANKKFFNTVSNTLHIPAKFE